MRERTAPERGASTMQMTLLKTESPRHFCSDNLLAPRKPVQPAPQGGLFSHQDRREYYLRIHRCLTWSSREWGWGYTGRGHHGTQNWKLANTQEKAHDSQRRRCLGLTLIQICSWADMNSCSVTNVCAPLCPQLLWPGRHGQIQALILLLYKRELTFD